MTQREADLENIMKLTKPTEYDYDFFALVTNGVYKNTIVYVDDCEDDSAIAFICDSDGFYDPVGSTVDIPYKYLLELPPQLGPMTEDINDR